MTAGTDDRERLNEILLADDPTDGLFIALETGLLARVLPEIPALAMEQDPIHRHKDVLTHSIAVTAKTSPRLRLRMAALLHDVGKPATRRYRSGKVTFYHHEAVGERMTIARLTDLGYEPSFVADVARLVGLSGRFHGYQHGWEDSAVRRYARDAGHLLGDLNELVRCDCTTRHANKVAALHKRVDDLETRVRALAIEEERKAERPDLNGEDVMELLGVTGRPVGDALRMLLEHKRAHGPMEHDDAVALLRAWWDERDKPSATSS
jgi:poly(A) polymerase